MKKYRISVIVIAIILAVILLLGDIIYSSNKVENEDNSYGNSVIKKCEAAEILSNALTLKNKADISLFEDISEDNEYYKTMQLCVGEGILSGEGKKINIDAELNKEQAYTMLVKAFDIEKTHNDKLTFLDLENVSEYALDSVTTLLDHKLIDLVDNKVNPKEKMTVKEFYDLVHKIKNNYREDSIDYKVVNNVKIVNSEKELKKAIYDSFVNYETQIVLNSDVYTHDELVSMLRHGNDYTGVISEVLVEYPNINYGYSRGGIVKSFILDENNKKVICNNCDTKFNIVYSTHFSNDLSKKELEKRYPKSVEQMKKEKQLVEEEAKKIVKKIIKPEMLAIEKEKAIHDYLISTAKYDIDGKNQSIRSFRTHQTAYGVLFEKKGVCASFARAFDIIAKEAGLDTKYIVGSSNGELHAWNMVKLDGEWYHVDVTWNNLNNGKKDYKYFNLTDDEIKKTHIIADNIDFPKARGKKYNINYLKENGLI